MPHGAKPDAIVASEGAGGPESVAARGTGATAMPAGRNDMEASTSEIPTAALTPQAESQVESSSALEPSVASPAPATEPPAEAAVAEEPFDAAPEASSRSSRFAAWRENRPFMGGLLMILSGVVIVTPAYLTFSVSDIQVQISTLSGVSTLLIGCLLMTCGAMAWFKGDSRILAGVAAIVLALVALPTSNIGGFVLGTLLGITGGALALSWSPEPGSPKASRRAGKKGRSAAPAVKAAGREARPSQAVNALVVIASVGAGLALHPSPVALSQPAPAFPAPPWAPGGWPLPLGNGTGTGTGTGAAPQQGATTSPQPAPGAPNGQPALPSGLQLPGLALPPQLPGLPAPGQPAPGAGSEIPGLPGWVPPVALPATVTVPGIGGFDTTPPPDLPGEANIAGSTYVITGDSAVLTGNVKLSYVTLNTAAGPRRGIRLDADDVLINNLGVQIPRKAGAPTQVDLVASPGHITRLSGNLHLVVSRLQLRPKVAGVEIPIPITVDASWAPEQVATELKKVGLGLPDALAQRLELLDVTMDAYYVSSDVLTAPPKVKISAQG